LIFDYHLDTITEVLNPLRTARCVRKSGSVAAGLEVTDIHPKSHGVAAK